MEGNSIVLARDLGELSQALKLIPRQGDCTDCSKQGDLKCPTCKDGEMCKFTVPEDCNSCATAICVKDPTVEEAEQNSDDDDGSGGGGPNIGAIAGGVIGGVVFIALLTYLAWRFFIRPKRAEEAMRQSQYSHRGYDQSQDSEKDAASRMTRRSSTHTVHSIASTVLTRASNIIQIAYIPGVTNRANPNSVLVPPVPPIPMEHSQHGSSDAGLGNDQHFFMPGDLRDSTYSGLSGYSDRTSYANRTSYAPRSSIASTIYGKQAQVMTPASTGLRAKPTMVSVKSIGSSGSGHTPPPVPDIDMEKYGSGYGKSRPKSGASTFSVGSTFLKTATEARAQGAQVVNVGGGGLKTVEIPSKSSGSAESGRATHAPPALTVNNSPFIDPPEGQTPSTPGMKSGSTPILGAVMEADADEEAHHDFGTSPSASRQRGYSPFGDEHATR